MSVSIKTPEDIEGMRLAGRQTAEILDFIGPYVKPGVTTDELDALCHKFMVETQKAIAANLNYTPPGHSPFPGVLAIGVVQS